MNSRVEELLKQLSNLLPKFHINWNSVAFLGAAKKMLPDVTYFSDFSDLLPDEVPLAQAAGNQVVQDFAKVSGLDLDKLAATQNPQSCRNLLSKHSAKLTGDFRSHWQQSKLDLIAQEDGDKLRFWVKDAPRAPYFTVRQRSKGFQWFLSFYLRLKAHGDNPNSVILVDEPGLYLHARAQRDVLEVLTELSASRQIIFSTHSPYLIDPKKLERVRLVQCDANGKTTILNGLHRPSDAETLTPVITALGMDLSRDLAFPGRKNLLLEGISDYYLLKAMHRVLCGGVTCDYAMIPAVGADNLPLLVQLMIGWGLPYIVLLDNDQKGDRVKRKLMDLLDVPEARILRVSTNAGESIEDLFTKADFNKLLSPTNQNADLATPNSAHMKAERISKPIAARTFLDAVLHGSNSVSLSPDTKTAFQNVLNRIAQVFSGQA